MDNPFGALIQAAIRTLTPAFCFLLVESFDFLERSFTTTVLGRLLNIHELEERQNGQSVMNNVGNFVTNCSHEI
jgi:hypothetical protein